MKFIENKKLIIVILILSVFVVSSCSFDSNRSILAEQKIGDFSRIILINSSSKPAFKFITDLKVKSFSPKWSPNKNNFAFISLENNKTTLWISNNDGTKLEIANNNNRQIKNFQWAPNSKEIAVEFESIESEGNIFLYSLNLKTFLPITRSDKVAKLGSWSPDSKWIVYNIEDSIYLSNPKGVNEIFITKGDDPKWSPNGEYLIFSKSDKNLKSIWIYKNIDKVVENTGKEINKKDYFGENIHDNLKVNVLEYEWAFGGNKILYINDQENNKEIYIMDVKSKKIERLTNNKVDESNIVWSDRYRSVLFTSNAHNNSDIYQMKPDGSSQEIILNSKDNFNFLDW
ncbi:MAG: hypothetical protein VX523_05640 [Chloroflexota bacterium]|nr:hypothetical protein [Chloroflexota bacterium]